MDSVQRGSNKPPSLYGTAEAALQPGKAPTRHSRTNTVFTSLTRMSMPPMHLSLKLSWANVHWEDLGFVACLLVPLSSTPQLRSLPLIHHHDHIPLKPKKKKEIFELTSGK